MRFFERPFPLEYVAKINLCVLRQQPKEFASKEAFNQAKILLMQINFLAQLLKILPENELRIYIPIFETLIYLSRQQFENMDEFKEILSELHSHLWLKFCHEKTALADLLHTLSSNKNYSDIVKEYLTKIISSGNKRLNYDILEDYYYQLSNQIDILKLQTAKLASKEKLDLLSQLRKQLVICYVANNQNDYSELITLIDAYKANTVSCSFMAALDNLRQHILLLLPLTDYEITKSSLRYVNK